MKKILGILILAVICLSSLMADLNEGLVAYYPFNGNANDESGNEHNGTNNGATATTDRFGNTDSAMEFSGSNNYITLGDWFTYQDFTISLWINQDQINYTYVDIIDNNHTDYRNWAVQYDNYSSNYTFFTQPQGGIQFNLPNSEWKHLVFIKDGASLKIYLNNVLVNELTATSSTIIYGSQTLSIARWGGNGRYFDGKIDEVRMYNRALVESEIEMLFLENTPPEVVQNLTINIINGVVNLSWDEIPGVSCYSIYSSDDPYSENWGAAIADGISTNYWSETTSETKKFYRVTAKN